MDAEQDLEMERQGNELRLDGIFFYFKIDLSLKGEI